MDAGGTSPRVSDSVRIFIKNFKTYVHFEAVHGEFHLFISNFVIYKQFNYKQHRVTFEMIVPQNWLLIKFKTARLQVKEN